MKSSVAILCVAAASMPALGADLDPQLRRRVEELVADVAARPTTEETAVERMAVLLEWANAASRDGAFVPKNLTLAGVYVPHPTPGTAMSPRYLRELDTWVRQLDWLDRDAAALGTIASIEPAVAVASSWQTIRVVWTVGSLGVAEGGGILVGRHIMGGYGALQRDDPKAANYVTVTTSDGAITLENDEAPVTGPYGGFRAAQQFPVFRLAGGSLGEGDTITVTYGDRSGGGPGFGIGPFSNDAIALPLLIDPGDGSFYELPLPTYEVVGGAAARVHGFAPSIVAAGERFVLSLRTEDLHYNRATASTPPYEMFENGRKIRDIPGGEALRRIPLELATEGVYRFSFRSPDGSVTGAANPVWVQGDPALRLYWGETHGHCGYAEGQGTPEGYFRFAEEDARLDFVALSEHDIWLTDGKWQTLNAVAEQFHREGDLVIFPGYEWSSPRQRGGHHNVFFRRPGFARVPVQEAWDLTMLYRGLRERYATEDVLIIPHAHQAGDWRLSDLDMETLVEIMSSHGTFEWFGERYLENGYRVGFVGASDDHIGHPGYAPGNPAGPRQRSNIFQFGGLAAAWADRHGTDPIFDALKARHAYATTGSQRIILDATLNGGRMGAELPMAAGRTVEGRVIGTAPIRSIDLVKNGQVLSTWDLEKTPVEGATREVVVGFHSESSVPFRDNPRGHITWRGSVTVENGTLEAARLLGTPNLTSDRLAVSGRSVRFDVATRGSRRSLVLDIAGATAATRLSFELAETRETGTAPSQRRVPDTFSARSFALPLPSGDEVAEKVLATGSYRDRVSVERPGRRDDVRFSFTDTGQPDDRYYVRVEQIDGHLAWSSPWWVGGERPR